MATIIDCGCQHGESPLWDERGNCIYWVDIPGKMLFSHSLSNQQTQQYSMPEQIGFVVLDRPGYLIAGMESGLARIGLSSNSIQWLGNPEPELPNNRFNDGKRDRQGRIWANTMDKQAANPCGSLYCCVIHDDDTVTFTKHDSHFTIGNGPTWSCDYKTFYHTQTRRSKIFAYDFDEVNGQISQKREFYHHNEADVRPDGMCTDSDNHLWVALAHGGRLIRLTPSGEVETEIDVNTSFPTSCAITRVNQLMVTTSRQVSSPGETINELSGHLLQCKI